MSEEFNTLHYLKPGQNLMVLWCMLQGDERDQYVTRTWMSDQGRPGRTVAGMVSGNIHDAAACGLDQAPKAVY